MKICKIVGKIIRVRYLIREKIEENNKANI